MKNMLIAFSFFLLPALCFGQDNSSKNSSIGLIFSPVPTQTVSATDTTYSNSLSVAPVLDLRSKSGWGVSYSPAIITSGAKTGLYMHSFSAGFERYGKGRADLAFSYNHFILTNKTSVPYSPISNEVFFYTSYTKSMIHPLISASFGFGKDTSDALDRTATELGIQLGVNHSFDWDQTGPFSAVEITPGLILNAGNNQFFSFLSASKYLSHSTHLLKQLKKSGKNGKNSNALSQLSVSNLELNTEISLEAGRFSLRPEGSVFLPVNGADHTVYGYWQLTAQYRF